MAATFVALLGFVLVHLVVPRLRRLAGAPRSIWLSIAGGVSVAYVFVHMLPMLSDSQATLDTSPQQARDNTGYHAYLIALLGLTVFYGLDKLALASRRHRRSADGQDRTSARVFWIHISFFAAYNCLIGYLLTRQDRQDGYGLLLFFVAMALHFLATDHALRELHKIDFDRKGRYALIIGVSLGWLLGSLTHLSQNMVAALFAFLAGGVILNVLKEELPEQRKSHYWAFVAGVLGYSLVLLQL